MLIRLASHHLNNPTHIDKLIFIKGLPDDWIFRSLPGGGRELKKPWEPDIDRNIPSEVRVLCEPMEITFNYPPLERGKEGFSEKKNILGLKLFYGTEPARELWEKIERYLEKTIPRDQLVPKPVLVARDLKSPFQLHEARRNSQGSLEYHPCEQVPMIDLGSYIISSPTSVPHIAIVPESEPVKASPKDPLEPDRINVPGHPFACLECNKKFRSKGIWAMHRGRFHKAEKLQAAGVS